ncbi:hypothetical protein ACHAWF_015121 [Thalassiosira exigua]
MATAGGDEGDAGGGGDSEGGTPGGKATTTPGTATATIPPIVPCAFHLRLPPHHRDEASGVPYATLAAHRKSRLVLKLVDGLVLRDELVQGWTREDDADVDDDEDMGGEDADGGVEDEDDDDDGDVHCDSRPPTSMKLRRRSRASPGRPRGGDEAARARSDLRFHPFERFVRFGMGKRSAETSPVRGNSDGSIFGGFGMRRGDEGAAVRHEDRFLRFIASLQRIGSAPVPRTRGVRAAILNSARRPRLEVGQRLTASFSGQGWKTSGTPEQTARGSPIVCSSQPPLLSRLTRPPPPLLRDAGSFRDDRFQRQLTLRCGRLQSQLNALSHSTDTKRLWPFAPREIGETLLKVLGLLCATVRAVDDDDDEEGGGSAGGSGGGTPGSAALASEAVGRILASGAAYDDDDAPSSGALLPREDERRLVRPFALPSPARSALLHAALALLAKKDLLRGASNAAVSIPDEEEEDGGRDNGNGGRHGDDWRLVISHRALLRMLLRTAPYLDERRVDVPPKEANGIRSSILKRTVTLVRACRGFFWQGGSEDGGDRDATARGLWRALKADVVYHTHSNSTFRALILLYLFHPSKCSREYYEEVVPIWTDCWRGNADRCPEADHLYLPPSSPSYAPFLSSLRKHLLTRSGYWLQIPTGGTSPDKSFPRAAPPGKRSFPARLKAFVGAGGRYEEGMEFVGRMCKLLAFCAGSYDDVADSVEGSAGATSSEGRGGRASAISDGTRELVTFLNHIAPYFNPSNTGAWTFPLGAFLHYLSYELCARVGVAAGMTLLRRDRPREAERLREEEPYSTRMELGGREVVALLDGMLPLCQQVRNQIVPRADACTFVTGGSTSFALRIVVPTLLPFVRHVNRCAAALYSQALYSKNPTVSHAAETSLLYLVQIDPRRIAPPLLDFSMRALDVSSVNLAHQAPAALSTLSRLLQPALRRSPEVVLRRLPDVLRLTLPGIDGNDQNKSLRTLIFYRNLVTWLPVGGGAIAAPGGGAEGDEVPGADGTVRVAPRLMEARYALSETGSYRDAIDALPPSSVLSGTVDDGQCSGDNAGCVLDPTLMEEAASAMSDWSLPLLDRVYSLLRAAGEAEKVGRGAGAAGHRHASADVAMARNFSRIMKETLTYFFAAMDEETHGAAVRSVARFLEEETLPFAAKDAGLLCQAACATRFVLDGGGGGSRVDRSPGLDALVPVLTEDLQHKSSKCAVYRLRCLAGAVRYAGSAVQEHRDAIVSAISFALSKPDDRILFKTGCKLLRHVLGSQCEEYPIAGNFHPFARRKGGASSDAENDFPVSLGASALLRGGKIWWHVPSGDQIDFVVELLSQFGLARWRELGKVPSASDAVGESNKVDLRQWRQAFRVLRYSLRGCSGILLDEDPEAILAHERIGDDADLMFCPKEAATARLLLSSSAETQRSLAGLRQKLSSDLLSIISLVATDTADCESFKLDNGVTGEGEVRKSETGSISTDLKICKEAIQLTELLLTRRGAQYTGSTGKTIWHGQKEILTDFCAASASDYVCSALSRCSGRPPLGNHTYYFKDGEDSGKTLSRGLLVNRVHIANQALTEAASSDLPRRLRRQWKRRERFDSASQEEPNNLLSLDMTLKEVQEQLSRSESDRKSQSFLEAYEALVDGLFSLTCHPQMLVRSLALSNAEFALSRFGWLSRQPRTTRLCNAILLSDENQRGVFGIPSCQTLMTQVNSQGKRARLAERNSINEPKAGYSNIGVITICEWLLEINHNDIVVYSLTNISIFCVDDVLVLVVVLTTEYIERRCSASPMKDRDETELWARLSEAEIGREVAEDRLREQEEELAALRAHETELWSQLMEAESTREVADDRLREQEEELAALRDTHGHLQEALETIDILRARMADDGDGSVAVFLWGSDNRYKLVKTLTGTQRVLKLIPPEEVPRFVHYVNSIFTAYRSKLFECQRSSKEDQKQHESCLEYLLGILRQEGGGSKLDGESDPEMVEDDGDATEGDLHWRDRLVAAWFILQFIDERDLLLGDPDIVSQVWSICAILIEKEVGQPLQRVSLGLLGRLVSLALVDTSQMEASQPSKCLPDLTVLRTMFATEKFCRAFGNALVFDHREDSSVGGGHGAQWSYGIEEILRDSGYNLARRTLFPFNRVSQKSHTFKLQHSQLIESILLAIGHGEALAVSKLLLQQALELVAAPPSEDQRNQQATSAEIFGGVSRALIQYSKDEDERDNIWAKMLLPFLDEAVVKVPTNLTSAFFDACRYSIHHFPPRFFFPLLRWSVAKVQNTLWQHEAVANEEQDDAEGTAASLADRFALQGKWLLFVQAVLAELDSEDDVGAACKLPWYCNGGDELKEEAVPTEERVELDLSWQHVNDNLTPCLLNAIGHPYDKCRDHIAMCLFRMCYCHRKFINTIKALTMGELQLSREVDDPGIEIMKRLSSIHDSKEYSFKEKNRALGTARKFLACCLHWGDAKHELPKFIIPLLPLAFQSLQTSEGEREVSSEDRGIEADLVKGYRYAIADISSSCVACYGVSEDMTSVLNILKEMSSHECWQVRQATAHFLRCFQGTHKFLFTKEQDDASLSIAISLLADDRREVSSAATSTLTGMLVVFPQSSLEELVAKYIKIANKSLKKKKKRNAPQPSPEITTEEAEMRAAKERARATRQQRSVFVLCAVVMGRPYDTPPYIPTTLAAISKHSFEARASMGVREVVKMVCSEYKRTHTDNWEAHRSQFTQEQLEAFEDVVSTPHYYA